MQNIIPALIASLTGALALAFDAIPRVIGFIIILIVGWLISGLLGGAVAALLRMVRFNDLAQRAGISGFVQRMGVRHDPFGVMAAIVKWFVRLITLVVAFDALGLPAVSNILNSFLLWIPNLAVALVILVITGLAATALADLVRGATSEGGFGNPNLFASITRFAVWAFGIVVAINQLGVAATLINTLFMGVVGALALALGLAFGLGGRDTAAQIVQGWDRRGQQVAPQVREAARTAADQQALNRAPGNGGSYR